MAFVMADDRLFATPHDRRRPLEFPRRERDQRLDVVIFAAAERAADLRVANDDVFDIEREHLGDLAAISCSHCPAVSTTSRSSSSSRRFPHRAADTRALAIDVVNAPSTTTAALGKGRIGVAAARCSTCSSTCLRESFASLCAGRSTIGRSSYSTRRCARAGVRGLLVSAGNERDAIAIEAHDLFAEQRLIGDHEAVAIVGHVFSGEHRHNTGHSRAQRSRRWRGCARVHGCAKTTFRRRCSSPTRSAGYFAEPVTFPRASGRGSELADKHTRRLAPSLGFACLDHRTRESYG